VPLHEAALHLRVYVRTPWRRSEADRVPVDDRCVKPLDRWKAGERPGAV
jgi:hypothetical protein